MQAADRPAKTVKGKSEIVSKSGELTLFDRRVLILINGENSISRIGDLSRLENIDVIIETLYRKGYIEGISEYDEDQTQALKVSS